MIKAWKYLLAWFHWSDKAVCEMSLYGYRDFHDYNDAKGNKTPWHFHTYECERCGKEFTI